MTAAWILNLSLSIFVIAVIVGGIAYALATQHRDHGVAFAGPLLRRRVWSRTRRANAGSRRPLFARDARRDPWPAL